MFNELLAIGCCVLVGLFAAAAIQVNLFGGPGNDY